MPPMPTEEIASTKSDRLISKLMRFDACLQLCALVAVCMPLAWIQYLHTAIGLGDFPTEPIAAYLARSLSAFYAMHGVMTWGLAHDVPRYRPLIRVWAFSFVALGVATIVICVAAKLPLFWTVAQGPFVITFGLAILALLKRSKFERKSQTS